MLAITSDSYDLIATLEARLRLALSQRADLQPDRVLSITLATPELATHRVPWLGEGSVYWARPKAQRYRYSNGWAAVVEVAGARRFAQLDQGFKALRRGWIHLDPDISGLVPEAFVGFSFDPGDATEHAGPGFGNTCLFVPSVLLQKKGPICGLTFSVRWEVASDAELLCRGWLRHVEELLSGAAECSEGGRRRQPLTRIANFPSDTQWLALADKALDAIRGGALEKVVLTRRLRVQAQRDFRPSRLLAWLEEHYPDCIQFAYRRHKQTLLGASPERLVSLREGEVVADAVAGTAMRDVDCGHDRLLGEGLLASDKARHEQALVVDDIVRALRSLCVDLDVPSAPRLLRLPNLQHLWSPIRGRVKPGVSLLEIAACLHPTPAVGGVPRAAALSWLAAQGEQQRGWYTGALGWLTADGEGEISVVLRCALLRDNVADLFAGAGIVAGSDPLAELAETEWKLQTMLEAFGVD